VPHTSTYALTNATLPYVTALADGGWGAALAADPAFAHGLSTVGGRLTSRLVAEAHGYAWADPADVLG
jgi:alanine dehydrogenase